MARPKRALTPDEAENARRYFTDMLKRTRIYDGGAALVAVKGVGTRDVYQNAKEALAALPSIERYRYDPLEKDAVARPDHERLAACQAFKAWLDEYITDAGWNKCLSNLRQGRFKRAHKRVALKLSMDVWVGLRNWAGKQSLTLDAAVIELVRLAEKREALPASAQRGR